MNLINLEPQAKNRGFKEFLLKRNPSKSFADKYVTYLKSSLVRNMTRQVIGNDDIFNVSSLKELNETDPYPMKRFVKCFSQFIDAKQDFFKRKAPCGQHGAS